METVKQIKNNNMNMLRTGVAAIVLASGLSIAGCATTTTEPKTSDQQILEKLDAQNDTLCLPHKFKIPIMHNYLGGAYAQLHSIPPCNLRR